MLPYEDIKNRIKKQLEYKFVWQVDTTETEINVDKIVLGLALINIKDKPGEGLILPCWYISYKEVREIVDQNENINTNTYEDTLVLNAIDGSVIEPRVTLTS